MLLADALLQPETPTVLNRPLISAMLQHKHRQQAEISGRSWDNQWNRDNEGRAALGQKKERKKNHSTHWPCDGLSSEYHFSCFSQPCSSLFHLLVVVCECRRTLVCRLFRENRYVRQKTAATAGIPLKMNLTTPSLFTIVWLMAVQYLQRVCTSPCNNVLKLVSESRWNRWNSRCILRLGSGASLIRCILYPKERTLIMRNDFHNRSLVFFRG